MKKSVVPILLLLFIFINSQESFANSHNNGNTKPQPENPQKEVQTPKYNFTLFSFFTNNDKAKPDSSNVNIPLRNNNSQKQD